MGGVLKKSLLISANTGICVCLMLVVFTFSLAQEPKITHVYPEAGYVNATIPVRIFGGQFQNAPITSIELRRFSCPDIPATAINVISDNCLTCSFNTDSAITGLYHLVVENGSGIDSLPLCFSIYELYPPAFRWTRSSVVSTPEPMRWVELGGTSYGCLNSDEMVVSYTYYDINTYNTRAEGMWWNGSQWENFVYGTISGAAMQDITIGDDNNDDFVDVYVACDHGTSGYVQVFQGPSWGESMVCDEGGDIETVAVGDGDNDGDPNIFAGGRYIYEFFQYTWNGSDWDRNVVGPTGHLHWDIAVGDANCDNELEVYVASNTSVIQFKWIDTSWVETEIDVNTRSVYGITVGDGDNDGDMEIYATYHEFAVFEYDWNGSGWDKTTIGVGGGSMREVAVGDGDGDGVMEVYSCCSNGMIYQFKWTGSSWETTALPLPGNGYVEDIEIGDGNNDGEMEIYSACGDHNIYQYKLVMAPWIVLSDTAHDFGLVEVGDSLDWNYLTIRNEGSDVLFVDSIGIDCADYYVINSTVPDTLLPGDSLLISVRFKPSAIGGIQGLMEIFSNDPFDNPATVLLTGEGSTGGVKEHQIVTTEDKLFVTNTINTEQIEFTIQVLSKIAVTLKIFNSAGRLQDILYSGTMTTGSHKIKWSPPAAGIYFYQYELSDRRYNGKLVVIE